jgi:hypothetical protein
MKPIPAELYDALEASANRHGGVGQGRYWDDQRQPCCLAGHLTDAYSWPHLDVYWPMLVVDGEPISVRNDRVVRAWQDEHDLPRDTRMPFADWAAAYGLQRKQPSNTPLP